MSGGRLLLLLLLVCQVMETKDAAVRDELYEEAQLLRRRQQDYKSELVGPAGERSVAPVRVNPDQSRQSRSIRIKPFQ
jgi:hypothetical protein